ncbi:MAG: cupin domain-containing protein, partial [Aquificaceae bacterium]
MMDVERAKEKLRAIGYEDIYLWQDPPGTYYDWHTHPKDEVRYILEGEITIGTQKEIYHLKAGDLLEVKAG